MIDLSIVIVNYNTKDHLINCLKSVFRHTHGLKFEVIVVDNASSDDSVAAVKAYAARKPIRVLPLDKNIGFGPANNRGAAAAKGDWLLFLNSDTLFNDNVLPRTLAKARSIPHLGALTCKLKNPDGTVQPTGGFFPNLFNLAAWMLFIDDLPYIDRLVKPVHPKTHWYRRSWSPDWITGAFFLTPKEVFNRVGEFDENIFMYVEDTEICYRLKKAGLKVVYLSHPSIIHLGGQSSSSGFGLVKEAEYLTYYFKKHHSPFSAAVASALIKLGALLRAVLFGIIIVDASKAKAYRQLLH